MSTFLRRPQNAKLPNAFPSGPPTPKVCKAGLISTLPELTVRLHRWLANPELDISQTATVKIGHKKDNDTEIPVVPIRLPPLLRQASPPPATRTLPPKVIHHQAMTKFHDVLRHVHTEADLQDLNTELEGLM
jgi:hypothetical protein